MSLAGVGRNWRFSKCVSHYLKVQISGGSGHRPPTSAGIRKLARITIPIMTKMLIDKRSADNLGTYPLHVHSMYFNRQTAHHHITESQTN